MGTERVREHDWSGAAVGPADRWPQSLQTALSICLSSGFPLHVWWGSELTLFYNDAYVPGAGRKHPDGFGAPEDRPADGEHRQAGRLHPHRRGGRPCPASEPPGARASA